VDPEQLDSEVASDNSSLSAPQAELMRRVNLALGDRLAHRQTGYNRLGKRYFAKEVLAAQIGPPLKLPARYAKVTRRLSRRMIEDIRAEGYHVVGDLADLEPTVFGESTGSVDQFSVDVNDATVAEAGVQAIATLLDRRYQDLLDLDDLRKRLAETENTWRRRMAQVRKHPGTLLDKVPHGLRAAAPEGVRRRVRRVVPRRRRR
jgi:hypothetical protein